MSCLLSKMLRLTSFRADGVIKVCHKKKVVRSCNSVFFFKKEYGERSKVGSKIALFS